MENVEMYPIDNPPPINIDELIIETKQDLVNEEIPKWLVDASDICGQTLTLESFQMNVDNSGNILETPEIVLTPEEIAAQAAIVAAQIAVKESLIAAENVANYQEREASDAVLAQKATTPEEIAAAQLRVYQDAHLVATAQIEAAKIAREADLKVKEALTAIAIAELQDQNLENSLQLDNILTGIDNNNSMNRSLVNSSVPNTIFIVPYRDRQQQQLFFDQHMKNIMQDIPSSQYKIFYVNQNDNRDFNRGAMKNIGFLAVKDLYPNDYKDITFVFNDVDTMPYTKNFLDYTTIRGIVKHFYGVQFALGGIVSMTGADFELCGGFPNFWSWGYEDNMLNKRVINAGLIIDRSQFYPLMDKNIFQMKDGLTRIVNRNEFDRYTSDTKEGWHSIRSLNYVVNDDTGFINVNWFETAVTPNPKQNTIHDLRTGSTPFKGIFGMAPRKTKATMGLRL